ncbi:HLH domain-containing protein/bHLH-MYC_N domain-containing protein [Cephalotus follicularis]|uniref:HLH domain-containing protein/bHLH-MYC_N domain-containing protein n=1 Tax=Cephalotus follicularis TaxID=3775 RepID=A0A1Q3CMK1_CEPFO|nr:HLH domain-containing protein/bHLH-MYC_N domain-containing protein [Cephalotus follicularis]
MRGLKIAVEWLRPLVDSKAWDYCVVWKLGDDPSRFIEWMGCCCSGGVGVDVNVKVEKGEEQDLLAPICKDAHYKHPIRTKACEALAHFPPFMPLYSGVHGEAVISNQPMWLTNHANDSNPSHETIGTRVFIPVFGGLIEIFAAKHIPKDQQIIELVSAYCNIPLEQENMIAQSYTKGILTKQQLDPLLEESLQNLAPPLHLLSFIPRIQFHLPHTQFNTLPSLEGSSRGSSPLNEHPSFDSHSSYACVSGSLKQSIGRSSVSKRPKQHDYVLELERRSLRAAKDNLKAMQRPDKGQWKSKNIVTERNRRERIRDGLFTLRSLVPKISKMDQTSILGDAIEYIGDLQKELEKLQDELRKIDKEDSDIDLDAELNLPKSDGVHVGKRYLPPTDQNKGFLDSCRKGKPEVQVEVNQIGERDFLIKFFSEKTRAGFAKMLEAINSIGLQVVDANITTFSGRVLNILRVEAIKNEIQPEKLRDTLIELAG